MKKTFCAVQNTCLESRANLSKKIVRYTGKMKPIKRRFINYLQFYWKLTLSNKAMYRENPNWSRRLIFSASCWQSSRAVVAESARRVFVFPSMKVMGSMRGFLDLVACNSSQLGGWFRVPLANVRRNRSSQ